LSIDSKFVEVVVSRLIVVCEISSLVIE